MYPICHPESSRVTVIFHRNTVLTAPFYLQLNIVTLTLFSYIHIKPDASKYFFNFPFFIYYPNQNFNLR